MGQRHRNGLCHRNNIFNAGMERGAHPALTRDSGSAVGCEHSRLGRGPMVQTGGSLRPRLPARGQTPWVLPVVPGLVDCTEACWEGTGRRGSWGKVAPWEGTFLEGGKGARPQTHPSSAPRQLSQGEEEGEAITGPGQRSTDSAHVSRSGLWTQGGPSHCTFLGLGDPSFALEENLDLHLPWSPIAPP